LKQIVNFVPKLLAARRAEKKKKKKKILFALAFTPVHLPVKDIR
jgi:hypothetical protein